MEEEQLLITVGEPLTKKQEADIITALKLGKGYFADEFTQSDAEIMVANIEADMPIISGTTLEEELREAKRKELKMEQERDQALAEVEELKKENDSLKVRMDEMSVKAEGLIGELEEARKNLKSLAADYAQLTEDYERKCELLDIAMAAIGRLAAKI